MALIDKLNAVPFVKVISHSDLHLLFHLTRGTRSAKNFIDLYLGRLVNGYQHLIYLKGGDSAEELQENKGTITEADRRERFYFMNSDHDFFLLRFDNSDIKPDDEESLRKRQERCRKIWDEIEDIADKFQLVDFSTPISKVHGIFAPPGYVPEHRDDLAHHIDFPIRAACLYLYDRNVKTVYSDLNLSCIRRGSGSIELSFDYLSEENKIIARRLLKEHPEHYDLNCDTFIIKIPIESDYETAGQKNRKALKLVEPFLSQEKNWGRIRYKKIIEKVSHK